ncbi:hypothetical protein HFO09_23345 [Rhizobium laguerreae]|uniref:hypothetical protein n=1 Tax=Rhizobium laguerreae TaxID=1076926 RepID=UPI001C902B43|nr:hypothetical protein [Rhizobium laguerreae]MBY3257093.1 hypothetical protein [Rhizobium laguerreae]MBY3282454.1 hypothetical protein [Rhizobium laguerreae]MBY3291981.1 hypothetical protein [Rhizobium laguerreae]
MRATEHLQLAFDIGMAGHPELQRRWIDVMYKVASRWGRAHMVSLTSTNRIDLLLRQLEREQLEGMQNGSSDAAANSVDVVVALAETWVLRTYEVIRAAAEQATRRGETNEKLATLKYRLGLVRMPIAKAEIKDVRAKEPVLDVFGLAGGERDPRPYKNDGSYIIPRGICGTTGSVMWWPIDIKQMTTVEIRRRELSDEFLSLFD